MVEQLEEMWQYAQRIADEEDSDPTPREFKKIDEEKIEKTAKKIEKIISKTQRPRPSQRLNCGYS